MQNVQFDVQTFMEKAAQGAPRYPSIPSQETLLLRARLPMEETLELCEGLGVTVYHKGVPIKMEDLHFETTRKPDIVKTMDAVCDLVYVAVGCAVAFGVRLAPIWKIVQACNLAKFAPGYRVRDDGKLLKPPGWNPPEEAIRKEIQNQVQG